MKKTIRLNTFETNSSSCHSLCIMNKKDFEKWHNDSNYYLYDGSSDYYFRNLDKKPKRGFIYSEEEIINFLLQIGEKVDFDDKELLYELFNNFCFYGSETYYDDDLEYYNEHFTTLSGDEIVCFGKYGYC